MDRTSDIIVIGAGIAGASAAWALSKKHRVVLLERESQPGYHTTGRSAAAYTRAYGNSTIRGLTAAGRGFFEAPPPGFAEHPLLSPRGFLFIARPDQMESLAAAEEDARPFAPDVARLGAEEARARVPALKAGHLAGAFLEPDASDIDVHALHQGFLRGFRAAGGSLVGNADVRGLERDGGLWRVATNAGDFAAGILVNAAGAWCDEIAALAGARPVGLVPKRRTAFLFTPSEAYDTAAWPVVIDVDEQFYFKPDAGKLLGSLADETPSPPCDAQPEELDLAMAVDRIETATDLTIRRLDHRWAGLRSFVADKSPVVGFDPALDGFFWLAGQGGYGIQTSPALARVTAALVEGADLPGDIAALGVSAEALAPARFASMEG